MDLKITLQILALNAQTKDSESIFARQMLVNAAKAAGIQAIDTVFSDVADMEALKTKCY